MPTKINCLIVDDDPMMQKLLSQFVEQTEHLQLQNTCGSAEEAGVVLKDTEVDLIFLDIEMPGMNGIEFIESLHQKPQIILITTKPEYAVDAYENDVVDYIIKPPEYPRFMKAVNKVSERFKSDDEMSMQKDKLFVKVDSQLVSIPVDDIRLIEAKADYVTIHTSERRLTVYSTMKGIERKLPTSKFIRVHRS